MKRFLLFASLSIVAFGFSFSSSFAEEAVRDGSWLKQGLSSCTKGIDNGKILPKATVDDAVRCLPSISWVMGYVAAQWSNNSMFQNHQSFLLSAIQDAKSRKNENDAMLFMSTLSIAKAYVPLYGIPNNLNSEQVITILLKYLNDHPEKWGDNAEDIVKNALRDAFLANNKK